MRTEPLTGKDLESVMELLLLADPSEDLVKKYLSEGECVVAKIDHEIIGAYIVVPFEERTIELVNIVVAENMQGRGLGKKLLLDAITRSKYNGYQRLEAGTGNSSVMQQAFYKKAGFKVIGIDEGFFTRNYKDPIIENGILCTDMIRFALDL